MVNVLGGGFSRMGTIVLGTSVAWGVQSLGDFSRWVLGSWGVGSWGVGSWGVGSQGGRVMGGRIATLLWMEQCRMIEAGPVQLGCGVGRGGDDQEHVD